MSDDDLVISDLEDSRPVKTKRIDLSINQPNKRSAAQKEALERAQQARKEAAEERRKKKKPDTPPVEEASQVTATEPDKKVEKTQPEPPKPKVVPHDEAKELRKKLKQIELDKLIQEKVNAALDQAEEDRFRMKEIKRLRRLEEEVESKKAEEAARMKRLIRLPDGRIFGQR